MRQMYIFILFIVLGSLSSLSGAGVNIAKISEWGTGIYHDVFVKGRYAYIAAGGNGLDIIDINNPSNPAAVGNQYLDSEAVSVHVSGNYAFVACKNGLHIVDVSVPASPSKVGFYSLSGYYDYVHGIGGVAREVIVGGNYAYLAVVYGKYSDLSIDILDVTDPANPQAAGPSIGAGEDYSNYGLQMLINGDYLFFLNSLGRSLEIVDVSTPTSPERKNSIYPATHFSVGGNHAYVVNNDDLKILDIGDPANPQERGSKVLDGRVREMFTLGNYLYIVYEISETESEMQILNVSDPSAPRVLGNLPFSSVPSELVVSGSTALASAWADGLLIFDATNPASPGLLKNYDLSWKPKDLALSNNRAYVAQSSGVKIFDISTPSLLTELGDYNSSRYVHKVAVSGNYVYLGTYEDGLRIVDVKDAANPVYVGTYWAGSPNDCTIRDVVVKEKRAYILKGYHDFYILDITNPASPREVGTLYVDEANNIHVHGDYALLSGAHGVDVVDISNPASPSLITDLYWIYTDTGPVFVQDGFAYVANNESSTRSLDIFRFDNPAAAVRTGQYNLNMPIVDLFAYGNYAYLLTYTGLEVLDVSKPRAVTLRGYFNANASGGAVCVEGDYIYMVASDSGKLSVLRFNGGSPPPQLRVNRKKLLFRGDEAGNITAPQSFSIDTPGDSNLAWSLSTLSWTLQSEVEWILCSRTGGSGSAEITVSIDPSIVESIQQNEYSPFALGVISISAPGAVNPETKIWVSIYTGESAETTEPFGEFSTPPDNAAVSGSIPVTGWALDNIGVESVKIYRETASGDLSFIGDAVFVEGARPDVEMRYPGYPGNFKAGWGYMLLTQGLPDGDGPLLLHVVAVDMEGNRVPLGTRSLTVDNAHSPDPFGAIDTPLQGGTASGREYVNYGWALTPLPNTIPPDGSTIRVWIDGEEAGQPVYNQYRRDLAELFPGYNNSSGAMGSFVIDTTGYFNGIHTIAWSVEDDAGNSDGIGSRYFKVLNETGGTAQTTARNGNQSLKAPAELETIETNPMPLSFKTGFDSDRPPVTAFPVDAGAAKIVIGELERVEVSPEAFGGRFISGYLLVGKTLRPLPIGSSLDPEEGIFYWLPGPGFVGTFNFIFIIEEKNGQLSKKRLDIVIDPRSH